MILLGEEISEKTLIISGTASLLTSLGAMYIFYKWIAPIIADRAANKAIQNYQTYFGF